MKNGNKIKEMLSEGNSYPIICQVLGVAKSTIAYHAKKMNMARFSLKNDVNWNDVQLEIDSGLDIHAICKKYEIKIHSLYLSRRKGYVNFGSIVKRHIPTSDMLTVDSTYDSGTVRKRILKENILPYYCSVSSCVLHNTSIWVGQSLEFHLDHINGIRNDHRIENLRFLCPNCHSQTSTYSGRNKMRSLQGSNP